MPKLKDYTATLGGLPISGGRRATAQDIGGGIGAGLENFGQTAQKTANAALTDIENGESRDVIVKSAQIRAKYAQALNDAATSGADVDKLKQQMNDDLANIGSNFATRQGQESLDQTTANVNLMFDEQSNRIKVQRAGADAKLKGSQWLQASSAILAHDPTQLGTLEQQANDFAATFTGIPQGQRALIADGLVKELNMSAVQAKARVDPQTAINELQAGQYKLTPEQRQYALRDADFALRAQRADQNAQRAQQDYERRQADEKARSGIVDSIMQGTAKMSDIVGNPDLTAASKENLVAFWHARTQEMLGEVKKSDPVTKNDMWLAINAPEGSPNKIYTSDAIYAAVKAGKLSTTDGSYFVNMLNANKDENNRTFSSALQARMTIIGHSLAAAPQYSTRPDLMSEIQLALVSKAEKKAHDMRTGSNPHSPAGMFDPSSKDYFFTPGLIKATADEVQARMAPAIAEPKTQAEYDALPGGTLYKDTDGVTKVKGGTPPGRGPTVSGKIGGIK